MGRPLLSVSSRQPLPRRRRARKQRPHRRPTRRSEMILLGNMNRPSGLFQQPCGGDLNSSSLNFGESFVHAFYLFKKYVYFHRKEFRRIAIFVAQALTCVVSNSV